MKSLPKPIYVYVCGIAYQHELGETDVKCYSSPEALKKGQECSKECGVVKLKVTGAEWIEKQRLLTFLPAAKKAKP